MASQIWTLSGSAKFEKEYHDWNRWLTFSGAVVFSLACFPSVMGKKEFYTAREKYILDQSHLSKIAESDRLLVINKDKYIGESTLKEILFALYNDVEVYSTEPISHLSERVSFFCTQADSADAIYKTDEHVLFEVLFRLSEEANG